MKRRTFLARVARTPVLGSVGYLAASEARTRASEYQAWAAAFQTPVAGNAPSLESIDARHAALLVLDYQAAWIQTLAESDALLARAAQAIAIARDFGAQVTYARVAFTPADYAAVLARNLIFSQLASRPGALDEDAPETAIDDRVAPSRPIKWSARRVWGRSREPISTPGSARARSTP